MKRALVVIPVIIIAGLFVWWWFSDKQVLKRRTGALLDTVTIEAGSGNIGRGLQAAGLDGFLAPRVKLEVPDEEASGSWSHDEIAAAFRFVAERADFTRFELDDIDSVRIEDESAIVIAEIDAEVRIGEAARVDGSYRTEFSWQKHDGRWRIARVSMSATGK